MLTGSPRSVHPPENNLAPKAVPHKRLGEDFESAEQGEGVLCRGLYRVRGGRLLRQLRRLSVAAQVHQQYLPGWQALQAGWGAAVALGSAAWRCAAALSPTAWAAKGGSRS